MKVRKLLGYIIFLLLIAAAIAGLSYFFSTRERPTYERPLQPVTVISPTTGSIASTLELKGYVQSETLVPVISMLGGTVTDVLFDEGEYIEKDTLMATTDKRAYQAQLVQAEAQNKVSESTYNRVLSLIDVDAATLQDLEGAAAQAEAAAAQLDMAKLQLSYTEITAPVSGTVLQKNITKGGTASPENPIAIMADLDDLSITLTVPYSYYPALTSAKELSFEVEESVSGAHSKASLQFISPYIDAASRSFIIKLHIDSPKLFRPGMYASVLISYDRVEDVPLLPQSIRKSDGSLYAVKDGKALYIPSSEITIENSDYFVVPEAYHNLSFISDGQNSVLDGESVNIIGGEE